MTKIFLVWFHSGRWWSDRGPRLVGTGGMGRIVRCNHGQRPSSQDCFSLPLTNIARTTCTYWLERRFWTWEWTPSFSLSWVVYSEKIFTNTNDFGLAGLWRRRIRTLLPVWVVLRTVFRVEQHLATSLRTILLARTRRDDEHYKPNRLWPEV